MKQELNKCKFEVIKFSIGLWAMLQRDGNIIKYPFDFPKNFSLINSFESIWKDRTGYKGSKN